MSNLNIGQHISQQYNAELEDIRSKVLAMGGLVEDQLAKALKAIDEGDAELSGEVVRDDYRINAMEVDIDEECTLVLARRQPAATDLRLVLAVIKTIADLERIGDEAERIGRMSEYMADKKFDRAILAEFSHMGELVKGMLHMVLDAFARSDAEAAIVVVKEDDRVDAKYESILRQLMTYMAEDAKYIQPSLNVLWAARSLERIGDRCQNISEYILYLIRGKDFRHTSLEQVMAEMGQTEEDN